MGDCSGLRVDGRDSRDAGNRRGRVGGQLAAGAARDNAIAMVVSGWGLVGRLAWDEAGCRMAQGCFGRCGGPAFAQRILGARSGHMSIAEGFVYFVLDILSCRALPLQNSWME